MSLPLCRSAFASHVARTAHYVIEAARPTVPALVSMILMQLEVAGLLDPAHVPSTIGREPAPR